jgi:two-component system chemotaxis response regulator CheB
MQSGPIRLLIAEDSRVCRELLVAIFESSPDFQVIGLAHNGQEAVTLTKRLQPQIITMDINMPMMDGYEATQEIMRESPCPIVMVSALFDAAETNLTFKAMQAGALSVIPKPSLGDPPEVFDHLLQQVKLMSEVKVVRRWQQRLPISQVSPVAPPPQSTMYLKMVGIAASTGGPGALATILKQLPPNLPVPISIVQHITPGFVDGLANWLNQQTELHVEIAKDNQKPEPGRVYLAPTYYHLRVNHRQRLVLDQAPPQNGLRPAANYLLESLADVYGAKAIGVILTGMGEDGAIGLQAMHTRGAPTIAQNEKSCIVFGMPAAAIRLQAADYILPLDKIAAQIVKLLH